MVGAIVRHKVYGAGKVTQVDEAANVISVEFEENIHKFVYPDAFEKHLVAEDAAIQKNMLSAIEDKKQGKQGTGITPVNETPRKEPPTKTPARISRPQITKKQPIHKNIIFKCNYCDGGVSGEQLGYDGICSEENIRYNIQKAVPRRPWCSNERSPCAEFIKGHCTYKDLAREMRSGGYICYESQLLREWNAYMGWNSSGDKAFKLPPSVRTNSLGVLTTREPNTSEAERIVFAVFLVGDHAEGSEEQEGWVTAHHEFRIKLAPDEARKILLWHYYANRNNPLTPIWGTGLTRLMDDDNATALLADIVDIKRGTKDEALANKLYSHFCTLNNQDADNPPEASGALRLAAQLE